MLCSVKDPLDLVVPDEINQRHTEVSRVLCGGRHSSLEPVTVDRLLWFSLDFLLCHLPS
jgi:hypothetical protein